jgi:hypothetical protein
LYIIPRRTPNERFVAGREFAEHLNETVGQRGYQFGGFWKGFLWAAKSMGRAEIYEEQKKQRRNTNDKIRGALGRYHATAVSSKTKAAILQDKNVVLSKNLSAYKRHFGPLPKEIAEKLPTVQEVDRDWGGEMTGFRDKL